MTWIVRITHYDGMEVAQEHPDALSAIWHAIGVMSSKFPAQEITLTRVGEPDEA